MVVTIKQSGAPILCAECDKDGIEVRVSEGIDKIEVMCTICGEKAEFGVLRGRETVIES